MALQPRSSKAVKPCTSSESSEFMMQLNFCRAFKLCTSSEVSLLPKQSRSFKAVSPCTSSEVSSLPEQSSFCKAGTPCTLSAVKSLFAQVSSIILPLRISFVPVWIKGMLVGAPLSIRKGMPPFIGTVTGFLSEVTA